MKHFLTKHIFGHGPSLASFFICRATNKEEHGAPAKKKRPTTGREKDGEAHVASVDPRKPGGNLSEEDSCNYGGLEASRLYIPLKLRGKIYVLPYHLWWHVDRRSPEHGAESKKKASPAPAIPSRPGSRPVPSLRCRRARLKGLKALGHQGNL